jgi:hypothetical protein
LNDISEVIRPVLPPRKGEEGLAGILIDGINPPNIFVCCFAGYSGALALKGEDNLGMTSVSRKSLSFSSISIK